ncbi:MAG: hypothetical protein IJN49_02190, partial [Clostridia bacterium]|nr:hypothetical protein [Clostridia bacterium]
MFVFSVTSKNIKYISVVLVLVICAGVLTTVSRVRLKNLNTKSVETKSDVINFKASNNKERLEFISQFGWEV